jgi:hypothetical protein
MARTPFYMILAGVTALSLVGCESKPIEKNLDNARYWQRVDSSSALYLQGPKAQQMLNKTIANCVAQLRELYHLGAIRYVMPAEISNGQVPDPDTPAGSLAEYETPTREGHLRAEHLDFHDFETCMVHYGWERVEHVPYNVADTARGVYVETISGEQYRSKTGERGFHIEGSEDDFSSLND